MARNNFGAMKTRITETLHDTSLSSQAGDWINEAIQDIHHRSKLIYLHVEDTLDTVASQQDYNFSDLTNVITNSEVMTILYIRDQTNDISLCEISYAELYDIIPDPENEGTSNPTNYAIKDQTILLYPTPDSVITLNVDYKKRSTDLSSDSDIPDLPIDWTDIILIGAEARGLRFLKRAEWAQTQQFYEGEVRRRLADERRPNKKHILKKHADFFRPLGPRIKL